MTTSPYHVPASTLIDTHLGPVEFAVVGNGRPILAFHGGGGGYDMAILTYSMFVDAGFCLICPSRPGYLRTPLSSGRTFAGQADLSACVLDHLGIDRVGVLGASAGGPPAYEFAIRHQDRAGALVVIDGICRTYHFEPIGKVAETIFLSDAGQRFQLWLSKIFPGEVVKALLQQEGSLTPQELRERVKHIVEDETKLDFIMKFYYSMYPYSNRHEGTWNDVDQGKVIDRLAVSAIQCPALIVHGERDNDVDIEDSRYAASAIPDAELLVVDKGTHFAFWVSDYADKVQQKAVAFFRRNL